MIKGSSGYHNRRDIQSPFLFAGLTLICFGSWIAGNILSIGYPIHEEATDPFLWKIIYKAMPNKETSYLTGLLLMAGGAFFLHRMNYALALIREKTYLPFFLYILLISTNPDFFPLTPASFGVPFLVIAIYQLFISYHNEEAQGLAYTTALLLSLCSLLWVQVLWFFPLFWFGMHNFKTLTVRTFLASLMGLFTTYWFLLGWCVWIRDFTPFTIIFSSLFNFQLQTFSGIEILSWIGVVLVFILFIIASINSAGNNYSNDQRTRQCLSFLIRFGIWSFLLAFIFEYSKKEFLQVAYIPSSIMIAHFFITIRDRVIKHVFYTVLLIFVTLLFLRLWSIL